MGNSAGHPPGCSSGYSSGHSSGYSSSRSSGHSLCLALHAELTKEQQQQAANIYLDERNWSIILNSDFAHRGYYPYSLEEAVEIVVDDAKSRDVIFSEGQVVLLAKEEQWRPIGSIHTVISNDHQVKSSFTAEDTWNAFTNYGRLSAERVSERAGGNFNSANPASSATATGTRWVCFAIQTDQDLDRKKWEIKPADLIMRGIRVLAFADSKEYAELGKEVEFSEEFKKGVGKYPAIQYINPLTRLSGFYQSRQRFPELTAADYAHKIERLFLYKDPPQSTFDLDLYSLTKKCSLRYHCRRGARIEQVIERFRVHDTASRGYGASVLYSR